MSVFIKFWCFLMTIWMSEGSIIFTAQCRSRCHSLYKSREDSQKLSQCLAPCVEDYAKLGSCIDFCKPWNPEAAPCHYSCKYVKGLYKKNVVTVTCSTRKPSNHEYCDRNIRCDHDELRGCCYRTNTCEDIVIHGGEEVKVIVSDVTSTSLLARWRPSNITGAVYIIQIRDLDSRTIYYTEADWSDWRQLRQGVGVKGIKLIGLFSGARLQLRVAIANSSGLQSIGPPTPVIRTLFNASNPSGPEQVWVMKKTYTQKSVSVTLVWKPPEILDVPVHSYRLFWKQIPLVTSDLAILTKKRTRVEGFQYNYTIENLKPDTTYNIEMQAICLWQKKRLKSPKVALNISTGHIKDTGKGIVEVYFPENKSGTDKDKHSTQFHDESIKDIEVLIEKQNDSTKSPSKDPNKSPTNSSVGKDPGLWLPLWLVLFVLAYCTN